MDIAVLGFIKIDRIKFFRDAFEEPYNLNNNLFVPVIPFTLQHLLDYVFR